MQQAQDIINLVTRYNPVTKAHAKLSRFGMNGLEVIRTIPTTNEAINQAIQDALAKGPTMGFYKYDLYNDAGEFEGSIFSIDTNLFD